MLLTYRWLINLNGWREPPSVRRQAPTKDIWGAKEKETHIVCVKEKEEYVEI
jgi:hypothetical protein